jgi:hypothetical protein
MHTTHVDQPEAADAKQMSGSLFATEYRTHYHFTEYFSLPKQKQIQSWRRAAQYCQNNKPFGATVITLFSTFVKPPYQYIFLIGPFSVIPRVSEKVLWDDGLRTLGEFDTKNMHHQELEPFIVLQNFASRGTRMDLSFKLHISQDPTPKLYEAKNCWECKGSLIGEQCRSKNKYIENT